MKRWLLALAMTAGFAAHAQEKLKSDPGYSPNNYKHPNKAAEARRWEENQKLAVSVPSYQALGRRPQDDNYKLRRGQVDPNATVIRFRARSVDSENPSQPSPNYKQQARPLTPNTRWAEKKRLSRDTSGTGDN